MFNEGWCSAPRVLPASHSPHRAKTVPAVQTRVRLGQLLLQHLVSPVVVAQGRADKVQDLGSGGDGASGQNQQ